MAYINAYNISLLLYSVLLFFLLPIYGYADSDLSPVERNVMLHVVVKNGDVQAVEALLNNPEVDVNSKDKDGLTPLHVAACEGHVEVVKELLATKDIQLNLKDKDDKIPLHMAAQEGHVEVVKELLATKNIQVNLPCEDGWAPLHIAHKMVM
ncbi:ankyrin repeat domain-containing protein [Cardinium endosymbiont of Bemisia tabaci]|nr:ankyrin repeat domain-containing protein [Cardinium endosymbiont of Bemisia tabaci]